MSNKSDIILENMAEAFDIRAEGYDEFMKNNVSEFDSFYSLITLPIKESYNRLEILDLGCGTGIEIEGILNKAPNSLITGIDLSDKMLEKLKLKYKKHMNQIKLIKDSYVTYSFNKKQYDYVISVMTMHHYLYDEKLLLYKKIKSALKKGGKYIEGDYVVSREKEKQLLEEYFCKIKLADKNQLYHIDIPMSEETQIKLFKEAGFSQVKVIFKGDENVIFEVTY